jgi:hypothetical protein
MIYVALVLMLVLDVEVVIGDRRMETRNEEKGDID